MPFLVNCKCGKKLRVADENQGKKVRCPACQGLVVAEPNGTAPAPKPPREEAPEAKRRPDRVRDDEAREEAPRKRPRRDEDEGDEGRPARKKRPAADDDEDDRPRQRSRPAKEDDEDSDRPARSRRKRGGRDDEYDDDRPSRKGKTKKSGSKALLWVGLGCGGLLFFGCAGLITLAVIFGKSPEDKLVGTWELDTEAARELNPNFLKDHKSFGYQLNKDGTYLNDENGSARTGKWRVDAGTKPSGGGVNVLMTRGNDKTEFVEEYRLVDDDHLHIHRSRGDVIPLKRTSRPIAEAPADGKGGGKTLVLLKEHTKDVVSLAFATDDSLASGSWDGTVKVWDAGTLPAAKR
jgi:hypothetical protein